MLDTSGWKYFRLDDFLSFEQGKVSVAGDLFDGDDIWYVGAKKESNGIIRKVQVVDELVSRGNCVVFICDGQGSVGYANYIDVDFMGTVNLALGYNKNLTPKRGLFIATVASLERHRFSYGRKWRGKVGATRIKMPVTESNEIDWDWIDTYMAERMGGCPKTNNVSRKNAIDTSQWQNFRLQEIFNIHYGVNLEYLNCEPVSSPEGVNFVSRTAMNCGVSGRVALIDGIEPEKKGTISIAGGGSVLSTFLQTEDYYSGRDLFVCESKEQLTNAQKLFVCALIRKEVYRFSYGRQANKSILNLTIKLPVEPNGRPDWPWIETYMKSLPYGDLI